ncbi:MAG: enoyl-CoA hydratase/isomerase family protein [Myxococcota bacterium]|nr:enoyl-CoA hydratase/isomerase family protein [Myxococcota bacterium]
MNQTIRADHFGDDGIIRVSYEKRGRIALFTLKDENLNGYTYKMFRDLDDCILRARFDPDVEVIVITGDGEHFCAGANINMLEAADATSKYYFCLHANETVSRLEQTPKLVIAAINGHCVGGGFEIALGCDLRIARNGGGRVGLPEVSLGVLPGTGGTQRLTRLIGASKAMEMMLSGQTYPVSTGVDLGLVHRLIGETETKEIKGKQRTIAAMSRDQFVDEVIAMANRYCSPERAGLAVGHIKRAVQSGGELPLEYGLALERELQAKLFSSEDAREGLAAFVEKRKASFKGQ